MEIFSQTWHVSSYSIYIHDLALKMMFGAKKKWADPLLKKMYAPNVLVLTRIFLDRIVSISFMFSQLSPISIRCTRLPQEWRCHHERMANISAISGWGCERMLLARAGDIMGGCITWGTHQGHCKHAPRRRGQGSAMLDARIYGILTYFFLGNFGHNACHVF